MTYELRVAPLDEFVAVEELGARALVGDADAALIPEGADVMLYGDGGAGKTTLAVDLACHLAAGDDWLGIPILEPVRVLLVENEGPRAPFRVKLRRKRDAWSGSPIEGRIIVAEEPWAQLYLADPECQIALAAAVSRHEVDVVVIGPVTASGMEDAGTLQDVRAFAALLHQVRVLADRRVAFLLVHHENKGGQVSGAWEGCGDTLLHLRAQGHGRALLHVQKARWASQYHGTTLSLVWADGESFTVEDKPGLDAEAIAGLILDYVRQNPGTGWTRVEEGTPGMSKTKRRRVRDVLFADGHLLNVVKRDMQEIVINHCPERTTSRLYISDDPTIRHLRPEPGADGAQSAPAKGADGQLHLRPAPRPIGAQGVGAADSHPQEVGVEQP